MIEIEQKYKFDTMLVELQGYYEENTFDSSQKKQIEEILFKINNIVAIVDKLDEDIYDSSISSDYTNCQSYFNYVISNENYGYLANLNNVLDTILSKLLKYIDFNLLYGNQTNIKNYIKTFKSKISREQKALEGQVSEISTFITNSTNEITNESSSLKEQIQTLKTNLSNLEIKANVLDESVSSFLEEQKGKVDIEFKESKKELTKKYEDLELKYKEEFDASSIQYNEKFDTLLSSLQKKDKQISELIGIVGKKSKIGEYKQNADSSHKERIIWQIITIVLFLTSFGAIIYLTVTLKDYDKLTLIKYGVSAIMMGAAAYTAKQASNSRKDEVYYRKQQLELASIDVYLESMEPQNREEIKKELSTKMFGQAKNTYTNKYDEGKGISIDDIIKLLESIKNK